MIRSLPVIKPFGQKRENSAIVGLTDAYHRGKRSEENHLVFREGSWEVWGAVTDRREKGRQGESKGTHPHC